MTLDHAQAALKKYFGYDSFRPLQADIIEAVYAGRDALVLMPTGGGKSICYQIPAVTLDGVAIVVSPLIALMKDQVEGLRANGIPAAFLNSTLTTEQVFQLENELLAGHIKLLYVSPEKLVTAGFRQLLSRLKVSLFAIDEAHCISSWGHDFRPEYTQLQFLKEQYPNTPMAALTATADRITRKDIVAQLRLSDPALFIASFDRPNIRLTVRPGQNRLGQILDFLKKHPDQSGIIYCLARKTCESLAQRLNAYGFRAAYYHAEMPPHQRSQAQEDFINDRVPIMCATIAFGMGIDKSNVRFVLHYNMPRNVESYYQEIGRCGRDGLPAEAVLFFSYADVMTYREMFERDETTPPEQKALKIDKLERMFEFAQVPVCRRKTVLAYFGETYDGNCGHCDVCLRPPQQFDGTIAAQKALSALKRVNERVGMNMLIDILRGSNRRDILERGHHQIKTYGAGKEYTFDEWAFLLSQMLHSGLIEIAYDDHNCLRVTEEGNKVLFQGKKVTLALPQPKEKASPTAREKALKAESLSGEVPGSLGENQHEELFQRLRELRRTIAVQQGVPPYVVFHDTTLQDMAVKCPLFVFDLLQVSGVGERKMERFGEAFVREIRRFALEKNPTGHKPKGISIIRTWALLDAGFSLEQIAEMRGLAPTTVAAHLAALYETGDNLDLSKWISAEALEHIQRVLPQLSEPYALSAVQELAGEQYHFDQIRFAIADYRRQRRVAATPTDNEAEEA
ncbi:MAG: DNA helicase RecQ [Saprospiraceae bacterium]|nr:DNA helicase RecQ [Saprospiraceae bacterium]MDW8230228.1 DNA helicase RecQ [Saprospiraceae bacterium]